VILQGKDKMAVPDKDAARSRLLVVLANA
jgi:hypothetical protein